MPCPHDLFTYAINNPHSAHAVLADLQAQYQRLDSLVARYYEALDRIARADVLDNKLSLIYVARAALADDV